MFRKSDIDKLRNTLGSQLILSREFVYEITGRFKGKAEITLSYPIQLIQDLIDINVKLKTELEQSDDLNLKEPEAMLAETLEYYFKALRIMKRRNRRNNIPTSQMAIEACRHSLNTLQTKLTK